MTGLRTAFAFLTRLPVPAPTDPSLRRAAVWFGVVGLVVGAIAAGVRLLAGLALPPLPATLLAVTAALLVTGALHEDGLADVADAAGAHVDRERRLEILKDPRVGTFGALALIVAVGLTTTTVATLDDAHAARALVVAHVLSRTAILPVSRLLAPAREGGAGSLLRVSTPSVAAGVALAAAAALGVAGPAPGAVAIGAAALATAAAVGLLRRSFGGVTGDGYGATAKLTEIAVCVALAALWSSD